MYWIQPDASRKIVAEHPRQRRIYDKTAVSYQGRRTESLDTAMVAAWRESQLKKLGGVRGKSVQDKVSGSSISIDAPRALGVASGGIEKNTRRNESTDASVLAKITGDNSMLEVLASKLGIAVEELSSKRGDIKESGGPTGEPDSTVEDEIVEDLDDEMVDDGTAEYLQRSFGKAVSIADGSGPSYNARDTTAIGPQLRSIPAPVSAEGTPSTARRDSADAENIIVGERRGSPNDGSERSKVL